MKKGEVNIILHVEKRNGETLTRIDIHRAPHASETITDILRLFRLGLDRAVQYDGHVTLRISFEGRALLMMSPARDVEREGARMGALLRELTMPPGASERPPPGR